MSWIALSDKNTSLFEPKPCDCGDLALLGKGSLVLETYLSPQDGPQTLISSRQRFPWERSFSLRALPGGGLVLLQSQGKETRHVTLQIDTKDRADLLRITYSWDAPRRWARLTVERPERKRVRSIAAPEPWPMLLDDIAAMARAQLEPYVVFCAFSDQIEPIGPMPSLTGDAVINCGGQYAPISSLSDGMCVTAAHHGRMSIVKRVSREVPARGSFRPLRLRAPYFGLREDVIVAPDQKLLIQKPVVEYLFGHEAVLVPARHLVNGASAVWEDSGPYITYHQLILPVHDSLDVAGAALESLNIGRIRRKESLRAQSLLADMERARLPEHLMSSHQVLRAFEAVTLAEQIAA